VHHLARLAHLAIVRGPELCHGDSGRFELNCGSIAPIVRIGRPLSMAGLLGGPIQRFTTPRSAACGPAAPVFLVVLCNWSRLGYIMHTSIVQRAP
jgi:hypothetical protein